MSAKTAPRKIPKNAPCPCGSGKRYKSCCQAADQAALSQQRRATRVVSSEHQVYAQMQEYREHYAKAILVHAARGGQRVQDPPYDAQAPGALALLTEWAAFDGERAEAYLEGPEAATLTPKTLASISAWRDGLTALWELRELLPGRGAVLKERFTGVERLVLWPDVNPELPLGAFVVGRVTCVLDTWFFTPHPHVMSPEAAAHAERALLKVVHPDRPPEQAPPLTAAQLRQPRVTYATLWIAGQIYAAVKARGQADALDLDALTRSAALSLS